MIKKKKSHCNFCGNSDVLFENSEWLTTKEAADYLRISVGSLKNRIYRGEIFPRKFGRLNRFRKRELDYLLDASRKRGA